MNQFFELLPVVLFFIVYKMEGQVLHLGDFQWQLDGIYSATLVLILSSTLLLAALKLTQKTLEQRQWWTWLLIVIFGSATIYFRNELFIQWKPSLLYWGMSITFLFMYHVKGTNLIQSMLQGQLELPQKAWNLLLNLWIISFLILGALNIFVALYYSQSAWVSYKLYSSFGASILLSIISTIIIVNYNQESNIND